MRYTNCAWSATIYCNPRIQSVCLKSFQASPPTSWWPASELDRTTIEPSTDSSTRSTVAASTRPTWIRYVPSTCAWSTVTPSHSARRHVNAGYALPIIAPLIIFIYFTHVRQFCPNADAGLTKSGIIFFKPASAFRQKSKHSLSDCLS